MRANDGQCLNLVLFSASNESAVVPTLLDGTLLHRRYLPNNVGTHFHLSILRQIMSTHYNKSSGYSAQLTIEWSRVSNPTDAAWKLVISWTPLCQCLSEEILKAVGPFYLVSMPGEVKDPTQGGKCVTCRGLHIDYLVNKVYTTQIKIVQRKAKECRCTYSPLRVSSSRVVSLNRTPTLLSHSW